MHAQWAGDVCVMGGVCEAGRGGISNCDWCVQISWFGSVDGHCILSLVTQFHNKAVVFPIDDFERSDIRVLE
jgi:hypothetical protein